MNEEQLYLNFDEYIKASEPHKRERELPPSLPSNTSSR